MSAFRRRPVSRASFGCVGQALPCEVSFLVTRVAFHVRFPSPTRFPASRPLFSLFLIVLDPSHQGLEFLMAFRYNAMSDSSCLRARTAFLVQRFWISTVSIAISKVRQLCLAHFNCRSSPTAVWKACSATFS